MASPRPLWSPIRTNERRLNDSDFGDDVTIAIAAITKPDDVIVCVSDRMISFGDALPADDNAVIKAVKLNDQWEAAWATNTVAVILPIVDEVRKRFATNPPVSGAEAAHGVAAVYSEMLQGQFVAQYLNRFGYTKVEQFRKEGRADLGDDQFRDLCAELARFDLGGTSFLLFGHEDRLRPRLFEICDPGRSVDLNMLGYGVIGSGYDMARASLRRRAFIGLEDTVYRLLEAKFSAETATGVGKTTTVLLRNREGLVRLLLWQRHRQNSGDLGGFSETAEPARGNQYHRKIGRNYRCSGRPLIRFCLRGARRHNLAKDLIKCLFAFIAAKLTGGLYEPPVLRLFTWFRLRLWLFGLCHMASRLSVYR
jgi:hypothetical protein